MVTKLKRDDGAKSEFYLVVSNERHVYTLEIKIIKANYGYNGFRLYKHASHISIIEMQQMQGPQGAAIGATRTGSVNLMVLCPLHLAASTPVRSSFICVNTYTLISIQSF